MTADFYIDDEGEPLDQELLLVEETREECIEAAIALARIEALDLYETQSIGVCLHDDKPPCPRRLPGGGCELCLRILVHPNGRVDRESAPA